MEDLFWCPPTYPVSGLVFTIYRLVDSDVRKVNATVTVDQDVRLLRVEDLSIGLMANANTHCSHVSMKDGRVLAMHIFQCRGNIVGL